jgi:hypothetical protein
MSADIFEFESLLCRKLLSEQPLPFLKIKVVGFIDFGGFYLNEFCISFLWAFVFFVALCFGPLLIAVTPV